MSEGKISQKKLVQVAVKSKVIIDNLESRNRCPACDSDFIVEDSNGLIAVSRFKRTFICQDCGKIFAHVYKLTYDQTLGVRDE